MPDYMYRYRVPVAGTAVGGSYMYLYDAAIIVPVGAPTSDDVHVPGTPYMCIM